MIRRKRRLQAEINVVPYIDVMLVLLVIFMITAPLLNQGVNVNLPQAQAKNILTQSQEPMVVSVDREGHYFLNVSETPTQPMTPEALVNRVAAERLVNQEKHQENLVLVKGDRDAAYGQVVQAMVLLQHAGIDHVGLMTETNHS